MTQKQFIAALLVTAPLTGFLWGFAEGTFFFIVPDVLISLVAIFSLRNFLLCAGTALLGSLLAGITVYYAVIHFADITSSLLHLVPFMPETMFETVRHGYEQQGVWTLVNGPVNGIPYKIYASLAPEFVAILPFVLASIPVRLGRFIVVGGFAFLVGALWRRYRKDFPARLVVAHAVMWFLFYAFYWFEMITPAADRAPLLP